MLSEADKVALRFAALYTGEVVRIREVQRVAERILAAQRESIATEIEAARTNCDSARIVCNYCRGLNDAAAIARGGAQ